MTDVRRIGVIGGTGVYDLDGVEYHDEVDVWTPYGSPSDQIRLGSYKGRELAFLPRHGRHHRFNPTHVPYQANIYAMKKMGVEWLISVNAVGSLKYEMKPLDFAVPNQIIDRTRFRTSTFFDPLAIHIGFADPFCDGLRKHLISATTECGVTVHEQGTYLCMEGPAFSTRAESNLYRAWGADMIGMTALPEAKLAREAEMCYAIVAGMTDYDCWHEEDVHIDMIISNLHKNSDNLKQLIKAAIPKIPETREGAACSCQHALANAKLSRKEEFPEDKREAFEFLMKKYI